MNINIKEIENYILWLEKFTENNPKFYCDDGLCLPEITKDNSKKTNELSSFYYFIDKYAKQNYIKQYDDNLKRYYIIEYNNIFYEIGKCIFQETVIFCNRLKIRNNNFVINLNRLLSNDNQAEYENNDIKQLKFILEKLYLAGVSNETIKNIADSEYNEQVKSKKGLVKCFKKC